MALSNMNSVDCSFCFSSVVEVQKLNNLGESAVNFYRTPFEP